MLWNLLLMHSFNFFEKEMEPKSGIFSVASIYNLITNQVDSLEDCHKKVLHLLWHNIAPLKVQCFCWMAQIGRLKTGTYLLNIGIIHEVQDALCKFCNDSLETIDHSLLHCIPVWTVWCHILNWWGIKWVLPPSVSSLFLWWTFQKFNSKAQQIWNCIPLAVLWSLWKFRNEFLFENKTLDWEEVTELIKVRVAFWVKSSLKIDYSINDFHYRLKSTLQSL